MAMSGWRRFDRATVNMERGAGAIYELGTGDGDEVIYIGSSGEAKTRLLAHLSGSEGSCTQSASIYRIDYQYDHQAAERRRYIEYLYDHDGQSPLCNDRRP
ncbi:MAG: hypothetical protein OXG04_23745 [Acidobacteria bacterium]|nr:hypothetical protein [Acidobacteriota bacterium]